MRAQAERTTNTMMATSRRIVYIPAYDNPFHMRPSFLAALLQFLLRPQALPYVCSFFLFITWTSIRIQRASLFQHFHSIDFEWSSEDDMKANLVRFSNGIPSYIAKDKRGWLLDPLCLARASGISGGAVSCASIHVGEIRPGRLRGNHRHHNGNETIVFWGAATKFRLENSKEGEKGYDQVMVGLEEIAVAFSPSGKAHALVNIDPVRSTFFIRCQDSITDYNDSSTDFNVWKDL